MSRLAIVKLVAEILDLGARAYSTAVSTEVARKNRERDEKIKALEAEVAALKEQK